MTSIHFTKARDALDFIATRAIISPSDRQASLTAAHVHATLALAEQQRIANLIALADLADRKYGNYAGTGGLTAVFEYGDTLESNMRLRPEIADALGIEVTA